MPSLPTVRDRRESPSRRQLAALVASRLGILRAVRTVRRKQGLLVLAHHRIGEPRACPVDEQLFAATGEELAGQVRVLLRWSRVLTLGEVQERAGRPGGGNLEGVLLTFDDAYRDNYEVAFPVLRSLGVSGVFFVPTGLIECGHVPWWDRLAYAVKHSRFPAFRLGYPEGYSLERIDSDPHGAVLQLLRFFKREATLEKERFVRAVEEAAAARAEGEVGELFASWAQLREMAEGGMELASHTHSHRLLDHLTFAEQREELARSREMLEAHTGVRTAAVAYPVGSRRHFNADTRRAMDELGYRVGFSHYGGWNPIVTDPYDIRRIRMDATVDAEMLRAAVCWPELFAV